MKSVTDGLEKNLVVAATHSRLLCSVMRIILEIETRYGAENMSPFAPNNTTKAAPSLWPSIWGFYNPVTGHD